MALKSMESLGRNLPKILQMAHFRRNTMSLLVYGPTQKKESAPPATKSNTKKLRAAIKRVPGEWRRLRRFENSLGQRGER